MLHISQSAYDRIREHAEAAYPDESCGILIGTVSPEFRSVEEAIAVRNIASMPKNRYEIAPLDLIRIEIAARQRSLEIVGFYHSHPDHPARWSPTDLAEAHWLGCSYIITAVQFVQAGKATETNAFHLAGTLEENKRFEPEEIAVILESQQLPSESE